MKDMRALIGMSTFVCLAAAVTCDAHSFPATAKSMTASLVQAYPQCTTPDTATSAGRPACLDTSEEDPGCLFGSRGIGTLKATITKTNVKLTATLKGLDISCESKTLMPALTVRTTTDDCPQEHCTVADYDLTGGLCVVRHGKCSITTSIPTLYPTGAGSEMTVLACGVKEGDRTAFTCGIMVK
jgi:hypothetical protein